MAYGADSLLVTAIVLPVLGIIAVFLRFYVRLRMRHTYIGIDDWLVLLSVLLVCGQGVIQILGTEVVFLFHHMRPASPRADWRRCHLRWGR